MDAVFDQALTADGWQRDVHIRVQDGRIVQLQANCPAGVAPRQPGIVLPGLANLHSHAFQHGFAGLTERRGAAEDHFWTWREAMYRFAGDLTPEGLRDIAVRAYRAMLRAGFTSVAEFHYVHHQADGTPYDDPAEMSLALIEAAVITGIDLTLLPVYYARAGFDGRACTPGQKRFVCDLDLYGRIHDRAAQAMAQAGAGRVGIAPHSLRAVSAADLTALVNAYPSGPIHIHIAEQMAEVEDCLAATGQRPVAWLLDHLPVDERWCLVHATHLDAAEIQALARSRAVAGLCPITEADLGDGIFAGTDYLAAGGRFGVGSDSNLLIDAAGELRLLEFSQRLRDRKRNCLSDGVRSTGRVLFDTALAGGAQANGLEGQGLALGARADLVVLDDRNPALVGRAGDAALDSWIFAGTGALVGAVMVAGRWCDVQQG